LSTATTGRRKTGDLAAIVAGFQPDAEHDVVGRPGPTLHGAAPIEEFYRALFADLRIDRFEPVRRRYGADHVVDESVLHATATGHPFGLDGPGRPVLTRFLHVVDFSRRPDQPGERFDRSRRDPTTVGTSVMRLATLVLPGRRRRGPRFDRWAGTVFVRS
jgi:uncharacterized protein